MIDENYRYVGVLATFLAWLGIGVVLWIWPVVRSKSISTHVSAYKAAWLIFAPIETAALLLLYLFMLNWFIPILGLSTMYIVLLTIALLLELITTWVPDTSGLKHKVHRITAYSAALMLPLLIIPVALSPIVPLIPKLLAYISLAVMGYILYLLFAIQAARKKHLIYQSVYFACFYIPILAVVFTVK